MTMPRGTVEVDADRLLDLLHDWRAVYHASTGVSHAFALSALANTMAGANHRALVGRGLGRQHRSRYRGR